MTQPLRFDQRTFVVRDASTDIQAIEAVHAQAINIHPEADGIEFGAVREGTGWRVFADYWRNPSRPTA